MNASLPEPLAVSAYIPCYNNAKTIALAIQGIQNQSYPVKELFVVDDASTDNSREIAKDMGIRVVSMEKNQGRGAVRSRAMEEARNEFVLCCDATNQLPIHFLEIALKWISSEGVSGIYGRLFDRNIQTAVDRWRARHLFQQELLHELEHGRYLCTYGAVVRKSAVMQAGNYNPLLRHGEDYDLGVRLSKTGDVIFDPALEVEPAVQNTLFEAMERFTRWNRAAITHYTLKNFYESHVLAWRILIPRDLEKRDVVAALISATVPYFALGFADRKSSKISTDSKPKTEIPTVPGN